MPRYVFTLVALICVALSQAGHAAEPSPASADSPAVATISYRRDVWPVLKRHCWGCHTGKEAKGGLSLDTFADFARGGQAGAPWVSGKPDESLMIGMMTGKVEPAMPKDGPALSTAKIKIVRDWILAGAHDDTAGATLSAPPAAPIVIPATYRLAPAVTGLAFSPDGHLLAAACQSEVVVVDLTNATGPRRLATEAELLSYVDFGPDGGTLVAAGGSPGLYGEVRFFNVADWGLRSVRRLGTDALFRGGFSPDGSRVAIGGTDGVVWIVSAPAEIEPQRLELHSDWVADVGFSPDGRLLISGGRDKTVKVSFADSGKLIRSVATSDQLIATIATAPGFAVAAGRDKTPAIYDLAKALAGTEFTAPNAADTKPIDDPTQYTRKFEAQTGDVLDCAVNADRTLLAVAGDFSEARIYRLADLSRVATISGLAPPIHAVALNAAGTQVACGSQTGEVTIHDVATGALITRLVPVPLETAAK